MKIPRKKYKTEKVQKDKQRSTKHMKQKIE